MKETHPRWRTTGKRTTFAPLPALPGCCCPLSLSVCASEVHPPSIHCHHHFFISLLFSILLNPFLLNHIMAKFSSLVLVAVLASLSSAIAASWNVNDINLSVTAKDGAKKADHK